MTISLITNSNTHNVVNSINVYNSIRSMVNYDNDIKLKGIKLNDDIFPIEKEYMEYLSPSDLFALIHVEKFYKLNIESDLLELKNLCNDIQIYYIGYGEKLTVSRLTTRDLDRVADHAGTDNIYFFIESEKAKIALTIYNYLHGSSSSKDKFNHGEIINSMVNDKKDSNLILQNLTIVKTIPECLEGNFGLTNLALFLQLTDKMDHCGFVYSDNRLHVANVKMMEKNKIHNKVAYVVNKQYVKNHYYAKNFVPVYNSDLFLPLQHVLDTEKEIYINEYDDQNYLSDDDIVFSHSCGYYNSDEKEVFQHDLYNHDDLIDLADGNRCLEEDAVYLDYENKNGWYLQSECTCLQNGEWAHDDDIVSINGRSYLNTDEDIFYCDSCNEYVHSDNYGQDGECDSCNTENRNSSGELKRMDYSTNVINKKGFGVTNHYINKKPVYLGLELECLANDESDDIDEINDFTDKCDYAIATKDGSLDDDLGTEYIFRPEGLEQQKDNVNDLISSLTDYMDNSMNDNNGYGLHVHVSSHFLGYATKIKIQNFVNEHFENLSIIGGRGKTQYQGFKTTHFNKLDRERYSFVNIQNTETIEYRFPKAVMCNEHINTNLELALALTMFCKFKLSLVTLKNDTQKAYREFYSYTQDNKSLYPLLAKKMDEIMIQSLNDALAKTSQYALSA